jgi:hypothetical protein
MVAREKPVDDRKLTRLVRECLNYDVPSTYLSNYYGEGSRHPVSRALVAAVADCVEWGYAS